jgi:hypothetical protein
VPLTYRDDVRDSLMDSVFARGDLSKAMPKYQFPDHESLPNDRQKTERARALSAATTPPLSCFLGVPGSRNAGGR